MKQMSRLFVPHITSRLGAVPWAIVYDAEFDSVLITIRGSKSVSDVLTDLMRTYDHPGSCRCGISGIARSEV